MNKYKVRLSDDDKRVKKLYHLCFNDDSISLERVLKSKIVIAYTDMELVMFGADGENTAVISEKNGHKLKIELTDSRQAMMNSFVSRNVRVAVV